MNHINATFLDFKLTDMVYGKTDFLVFYGATLVIPVPDLFKGQIIHVDYCSHFLIFSG